MTTTVPIETGNCPKRTVNPQHTQKSPPTVALPAPSVFTNCFPHGHKVIWTSGAELLCGARAIILSLKHQFPGFESPTLDQARINLALINPDDAQLNNYAADLLAAFVEQLGDRQGHDFRLGI